MMKFELTYNPFTHERTFLAQGKPATLSNCWGDDDSKELSEWCGDFFKAVKDKFNDSEMEVCFNGILRDFEFLSDAREEYLLKNPDDTIKLNGDGCVNTKAKLDELRQLFGEMQRDSPFPELKTQDLKQLFEATMSSEFEMAVVATMSSGKSTLINSMLGCELLPARNKATTATLAKIHDIDGMTGFTGTSYDADENPITSCNPLTLCDMNKLNDNPNASLIEIEGDIVGVESRDLRLVLTDTPGPNNSKEGEGKRHRSHTYKLLKAEYKPMILYVLDSTKLEDDSDNNLLKDVAEAMMSGGRQSQERFLFVMNKADAFDSDNGESVLAIIDDAKKYLAKHGIKNARIFPAVALMAKVIRQFLNGTRLTPREQGIVLPQYEYYIKEPSMHFSDFAPLSPSARKELNEKLSDARGKGDKYREALIYTGIPAIELAISEYLAKYALPAKIAEGVRSFKDKIDSFGVEAIATAKLEENEVAVKKLNADLSKLSDLIEKGEKAKELRDVIDGFSSDKSIKERFEKARVGCQKSITSFIQQKAKNGVTTQEADRWNLELTKMLAEAECKFKVNIDEALNKAIKEQADAAVKEYNKYLEALVGDVTHESKDAILGASVNMSVKESLDAFTKNVVVGHKLKAQDGKWGKVKRFFGGIVGEDWGYDSVAVYGDRVDFATFLETKVLPKVEQFFINARKIAFEQAKEKEREFKEFYKGKLHEMDTKLKEKVAEKEKNLSSKDAIEQMIKTNKENLAWLNDFKKKLDDVLAI